VAHDLLLFARQFLHHPSQIAAISPSSRFLARAMAAGLGPLTGPVVEFGPGTGQLTKGILAAGVAPENLTLFEMSADFTPLLQMRFAGVTVHRAGAQLAANFVAKGSVGAVVSGLPLLSMPDPVVQAILTAAFDILRPDGAYIQFTYGNKPPIPPQVMQTLGLEAVVGKKVWLNVPPARVYYLRRKAGIHTD
jgi:phosphatidylethanolamine/phosphatidyl-N-methylethanolamine N-methyltransferase